jgi:hypothetical protein
MPTAEGVFPKVGNDPIYASEVNTIKNSTKIQYIPIGTEANNSNSSSYVIPGDYPTYFYIDPLDYDSTAKFYLYCMTSFTTGAGGEQPYVQLYNITDEVQVVEILITTQDKIYNTSSEFTPITGKQYKLEYKTNTGNVLIKNAFIKVVTA